MGCCVEILTLSRGLLPLCQRYPIIKKVGDELRAYMRRVKSEKKSRGFFSVNKSPQNNKIKAAIV